jgi:hypothetical protein
MSTSCSKLLMLTPFNARAACRWCR